MIAVLFLGLLWVQRRLSRVSREIASLQAAQAESERAHQRVLQKVSHEVRSAANGVLGMTQMVLDGHPSAEHREYLLAAQNSADSLLALLTNVQQLTAAQAPDPESSVLDLGRLLSDAMQACREVARQRRVKLILEIGRGVPDYVWGDPTGLRQIVDNLLSNAIHLTLEGEVHLTVTKRPNGEGLTFDVADSGPGIPPDRLPWLFDEAEGDVSRPFRASGLGLKIAQRLVKRMGGNIGVQSTPGVGSRFWFHLPCKEATPADALPHLRNPMDRVLVLDSHPISSRILLSYADQWNGLLGGEDGMPNASVARAVEALVLLDQAERSRKPFRVLVMDDQLEDRSAASVVATVRAHRRFDEVRIVLLASSPEEYCQNLTGVQVVPQPASRLEFWNALAGHPDKNANRANRRRPSMRDAADSALDLEPSSRPQT